MTDRLLALPEIARGLRTATDTQDLFARVATACVEHGGFERAVVLSASGGMLTAADCGAIADRASDQLRRQVRAQPLPITPGTVEAELIRRPDAAPRGTASALADALGLVNHAYAPLIVDVHAVALLVVDRPARELTREDELWLHLFAPLVALTLETQIVRERVDDLVSELRHSTTSTLALAHEVLDGAIALPSNRGADASLPRIGASAQTSIETISQFTDRERRVVGLLAGGHSNRAIADQLVLSPETVKTHVSRILRKLGAHNRAEAVAMILRTPRG